MTVSQITLDCQDKYPYNSVKFVRALKPFGKNAVVCSCKVKEDFCMKFLMNIKRFRVYLEIEQG